MKIEFDDDSFVELLNSSPGKISIVLGARDHKNPLNIVINSAEITIKEFQKLLSDIEINFLELNKENVENTEDEQLKK